MSSIPFLTLSQILTAIERTPSASKTKLVAIDGRGGSGKSSLAEALSSSRLAAQVVHVDDFPFRASEYPFHPSGTQTRVNLDRLITEVLLPLRAGKRAVYKRTRWWMTQVANPETELATTPGGTVIVEGCYTLHRTLRSFFDLRIWVECPARLGVERALTRDKSPHIRQIWNDVYVPNESAYITAHHPQEAADIIVYNDLERLFALDEKTYNQALQRIALLSGR
jgi:uridine kinase